MPLGTNEDFSGVLPEATYAMSSNLHHTHPFGSSNG